MIGGAALMLTYPVWMLRRGVAGALHWVFEALAYAVGFPRVPVAATAAGRFFFLGWIAAGLWRQRWRARR